MTSLVWLPGLDGLDGDHWAPLEADMTPAERAASRFVRLPPGPQTYDALCDAVVGDLPAGPLVLIGESFSSPLATRLAHRVPCAGLLLVTGFITPPLRCPPTAVRLGARLALRLPIPSFVLRRLLVGSAGADVLDKVHELLAEVDPGAMADRLAAVASVDVRDAWAQAPCAVAYLAATRDALLPPSSLEDVRRARPDVTVLRVDAPHLALQVAPAASLDALRTLPFWPT